MSFPLIVFVRLLYRKFVPNVNYPLGEAKWPGFLLTDTEAQLLVNEVFSGYSALLGDHAALLDFTFGTQLVEWRQVKFAIAIRCKSKPQEDSPRWLETEHAHSSSTEIQNAHA